MRAIWKRELQNYYLTSIGYVFMGIFLLVGGVCFLIAGIGRKSRQYLLASLGCFAAPVAGF